MPSPAEDDPPIRDHLVGSLCEDCGVALKLQLWYAGDRSPVTTVEEGQDGILWAHCSWCHTTNYFRSL